MKVNEYKNSVLFQRIISHIFDEKLSNRTYSLVHHSVKYEDYEPLLQMVEDKAPNWFNGFKAVKYWIFFHPNGEIDISFSDGVKTSNAEVCINVAAGTIEAL